MIAKTNIDQFLTNLYQQYWDTLGSRNEIERSLSEINQFNSFEYLQLLINVKYSADFVLSNLLYNPKLWIGLNKDDWITLMTNVDRHTDEKFIIDNYGNYCDVIFLYKYLQVDSILLIATAKLQTTEKSTIYKNVEKLLSLMVMTDLDRENFADGTYPDHLQYENARKKLIDQGCLSAKNTNEQVSADLKKYMIS